MEKKVTDFINGKVVYGKGSQSLFIESPNLVGYILLGNIKGWLEIQNLFTENNVCNETAAEQYQDKIGQFIADAINEKIERDFG